MDYAILVNPTIKKPITSERVIYKCALTLSGLSTAYLLSVFITGRTWLPLSAIESDSSELTLSLLQCLLGMAALNIPKLITKLTKVKLPGALCSLFYTFVICGTVLGEVFSLYYKIPVWDSLLHIGSGVMTGMLGSIFLVSFLENKKCGRLISPMFIAIASMCFAICIGVLWEFYEFAGDSLLGLNMQKFMLEDGTELIGKAALLDTMKDLMVDAAGAIAAAAASFTSLKRKTGWLHVYRTNDENTARIISDERQVLLRSA